MELELCTGSKINFDHLKNMVIDQIRLKTSIHIKWTKTSYYYVFHTNILIENCFKLMILFFSEINQSF